MGDSAAEAKIKELEAKAAAEKARADKAEQDKEDERKRQESIGMFGRIWDLFKDNFWTIALLFIGAAIAVQTWGVDGIKELFGKAKDFFGNLIDDGINLLPEGWQPGIRKFISGIKGMFGGDVSEYLANESVDQVVERLEAATKVDKAILKTYLKDDNAKNALIAFLKNENGGKFAQSDLTNDKTIYALMTSKDYAPLFIEVAKASLKGNDSSKPLDANGIAVVNALRTIVASERLDALVTTHKATTTDLLKAIKPENAKEIDTMMQYGSVANGKAAEPFRKLLTTMLTVSSDGKLPDKVTIDAAIQEFRTATPGLVMKGLNDFKSTDAGRAFEGNNGGNAYKAAVKAAGDEVALANLLAGFDAKKSNPREQMQYALRNRAVFDAYDKASDPKTLPPSYQAPLALLRSIPKEATAPLIRILDRTDPAPLLQLAKMEGGFSAGKITGLLALNPKLGDALLAAGPADVVEVAKAYAKQSNTPLPEGFTADTMVAMINTIKKVNMPERVDPEKLKNMTPAEKLAAAPETVDAKREKTALFLAALTEKLAKQDKADPAVVQYLTPDNMAFFMRDEKNAKAFWETAGGLKGLPEKQEKTLIVLLKHQAAITDVMRDAGNGAPRVIELLNTLGGDASCKTMSDMKEPSVFDTFGFNLTLNPAKMVYFNSLGRNGAELKQMAEEMKLVYCSEPAAPQTPRPAASAPAHAASK